MPLAGGGFQASADSPRVHPPVVGVRSRIDRHQRPAGLPGGIRQRVWHISLANGHRLLVSIQCDEGDRFWPDADINAQENREICSWIL